MAELIKKLVRSGWTVEQLANETEVWAREHPGYTVGPMYEDNDGLGVIVPLCSPEFMTQGRAMFAPAAP